MKGESALETLKRETMEELGVELDVKYAIYDEIEGLFQNNLFIDNRWEYLRDEIREYLLRSLDCKNFK